LVELVDSVQCREEEHKELTVNTALLAVTVDHSDVT
jgi:hypothetical protein